MEHLIEFFLRGDSADVEVGVFLDEVAYPFRGQWEGCSMACPIFVTVCIGEDLKWCAFSQSGVERLSG